MEDHLSDEQVAKTARGQFSLSDRLTIVRHLLRRCPDCWGRLSVEVAKLVPSKNETLAQPSSSLYNAAILRALESLPEALASRATTLRFCPVEIPSRLTGPERVDFLIRKSFDARYRDVREMLQLAFWAKTAAQALRPVDDGPKQVADVQARAWAEYANALRVADELRDAKEAFDEALLCFESGTRDPLIWAHIQELRATYFKEVHEFEEALVLLAEAEWLYRANGELHFAGRALVARGLYEVEAGLHRLARKHLAEGLALLDRRKDPELRLAAQQNLILSLTESGDYREAARAMMASGLREKLSTSPLAVLRLRWIEGKIQVGLGNFETAERAFQEARRGFFVHDQGVNAARVSMDLASLWYRQGRYNEVTEVAREVYERFQAVGVAFEAKRALSMLIAACEQELLTSTMISSVSNFLEDLEKNPQLRFRGF